MTVVAAALAGAGFAAWQIRHSAIVDIDSASLQEYAGVYQWDPDAFVYLQPWNELAGTHQLGAFDESGEIRTLYPTGPDQFVTGPGAAVSSPVEARVAFERDASGTIVAFTWQRANAPPRRAVRADLEAIRLA